MPHADICTGSFEVQARETGPDAVAALAVDAQGRLPTDFGRKDTVLVWPGESVRVAVDLPPFLDRRLTCFTATTSNTRTPG
jgi:hypothetical protein